MFSLHFWHSRPRPFTEWVMHHTAAEITYELSKIKATELSIFLFLFFYVFHIHSDLLWLTRVYRSSAMYGLFFSSFLSAAASAFLNNTLFLCYELCVDWLFSFFLSPFFFSLLLCRLIPPFGFCVTSLIFARLNSSDARFSLIKLLQTHSIGSFFSLFSENFPALSRRSLELRNFSIFCLACARGGMLMVAKHKQRISSHHIFMSDDGLCCDAFFFASPVRRIFPERNWANKFVLFWRKRRGFKMIFGASQHPEEMIWKLPQIEYFLFINYLDMRWWSIFMIILKVVT